MYPPSSPTIAPPYVVGRLASITSSSIGREPGAEDYGEGTVPSP